MRRKRLLPDPEAPVIATHSPRASIRSNGPANSLRSPSIRSRGPVRSIGRSGVTELAEQAGVAAHTVVEAPDLELLVRAMNLIVLQAEAKQQAVEAKLAFEGFDDRDRAATANHYRRFPVFLR